MVIREVVLVSVALAGFVAAAAPRVLQAQQDRAWQRTSEALRPQPDSAAQFAEESRLFPGRALLPGLLAGPLDPVIAAKLIYSGSDPTGHGSGFAGDVALGAALPVLLLAGTRADDALVLGMEAAVFGRFSFVVIERDLVNTDWVFAVPLAWRRGTHWVRLRYYHISSHLGDQYAARFGAEPIRFARDGADVTGYLDAGAGLGVYVLGFVSANSHPTGSRGSHLRAGLEFDPSGRREWRPFAAADVQADRSTGWTPRLAAQAGVWLPHAAGRPLRLFVELSHGPSAMGQFHGQHAAHAGAGLAWTH
jgi:hypothetical protein